MLGGVGVINRLMVCRKTNSQEFHKGAWERFDSGDVYEITRIYCTNQTPATEWTASEKKRDGHIQSGHGLSRFNVKDSDGQTPRPTFHRFSLAFLNQSVLNTEHTMDSTFRQIPEEEKHVIQASVSIRSLLFFWIPYSTSSSKIFL